MSQRLLRRPSAQRSSPLGRQWLAAVAALAILLPALPPAVGAEEAAPAGAVRIGAAAFGDFSSDAPGVRRLIRPSDLPPPHATRSVSNGARLVRRPAEVPLALPPGFTVSAFLTGLETPRQMRTAPNGDIFLAESGADRIRIIRAAAGATTASGASVFVAGLADRPYGIAFYPLGPDPQWVYVATEGQVLRFPYRNGDLKARGPAQIIVPDVPIGHHWTRDIAISPDGKLFQIGRASCRERV